MKIATENQNETMKNESTSKPINLTKEMFKEKILDYEHNMDTWKYLGDKPAIIDFYATWCGPCKAVAPVLEELAKEYDGKIYIYKVDVDQEQELAGIFGISSVPTLLFVPMNENPQMSTGAMPKEGFIQAINDLLLK
jgi:thioredoxin 2